MAASDYVHYLQKLLASFGASTDGEWTFKNTLVTPDLIRDPRRGGGYGSRIKSGMAMKQRIAIARQPP